MTARRIARSLRALWRRLEERLGEADFIIVTTPETPDTSGMFNARLFSRMKRGAYFINIARGRCVVTQDLVAALQSGQLAGAGLDVVDPEPLPPDSPLWRGCAEIAWR
jgi:D-2-hydroxyacid dehydrogenase (NADP+)